VAHDAADRIGQKQARRPEIHESGSLDGVARSDVGGRRLDEQAP
jgi:hypothetical protein